MSTVTLKIDVTWSADLAVPEGATANLQLWVGNQLISYRMISDGDLSAPASGASAQLQVSFDSDELLPSDSTVTWGYLHGAPYLAHEGKRLNNANMQKISVEEALKDGWKVVIA